jgi:hypothetical protein
VLLVLTPTPTSIFVSIVRRVHLKVTTDGSFLLLRAIGKVDELDSQLLVISKTNGKLMSLNK